MTYMISSLRRAPRPASWRVGLALVAAAALTLAFVGHAMAATLGQDTPTFELPVWFLGLAPTLSYILNAVVFKAIEKGSGKELDTNTKRIITVAVSMVAAVLLAVSGAVPLPAPIPTDPDPFAWGGWLVGMTAWTWAGATTIYAAIEAAKAVTGVEKKPELSDRRL